MSSSKDFPKAPSDAGFITRSCQKAIDAATDLDQRLNSSRKRRNAKLWSAAKEIGPLLRALGLAQAKADDFSETSTGNHVGNIISACNVAVCDANDLARAGHWENATDGEIERLQGSLSGATSALSLALQVLTLRATIKQDLPRTVILEFKDVCRRPAGAESTIITDMEDLPRQVTIRRSEARISPVTTTAISTTLTQGNSNQRVLRLQLVDKRRHSAGPTATDKKGKKRDAERIAAKSDNEDQNCDGESRGHEGDAKTSEQQNLEAESETGLHVANIQPANTPDAQERTRKTVRERILFGGHLDIDIPCRTATREMLQIPAEARNEYSHVRYTAMTYTRDEFAVDPTWKIRQSLFTKPRVTDLFVSVAIYKSSDLVPALQKIWSTFDALDDGLKACRDGSLRAGNWKHRVLHIHCPIYPDEHGQTCFNQLGVRPKTPGKGAFLDSSRDAEDIFPEKESVSREEVVWHTYEYTAKLRLAPNGHDEQTGKAQYMAYLNDETDPVQIIVTNGRRQVDIDWSGNITVFPQALFGPTWKEVRHSLSAKLEPSVVLYGDGECVKKYFGMDVVDQACKRRQKNEDIGEISVDSAWKIEKPPPAPEPRPTKRWLFCL